MSDKGSALYTEDDQLWMRVSPGHSVNVDWITEHAPDLLDDWQAAPSAAQRDGLALQIERRLDEIEGMYGSLTHDPAGAQGSTDLFDRVADYEHAAGRLGALSFDDPTRATTHLAHQRVGVVLRDAVNACTPAVANNLSRRLDAADLVADRPVIEVVAEIDVDRLAVVALYESTLANEPPFRADPACSEMTRAD